MKRSPLATAVVAIVVLSELAIPVPVRADDITSPCNPRLLSRNAIVAEPTATPATPPRFAVHPVLGSGPASPAPTTAGRIIKPSTIAPPPITCAPAILKIIIQTVGSYTFGVDACLVNVIDMSLSMTADGPPFWTGHPAACQATFTQLPKGVPLYLKLAWVKGQYCNNPVAAKGTFTIPSSFPSNSATP